MLTLLIISEYLSEVLSGRSIITDQRRCQTKTQILR